MLETIPHHIGLWIALAGFAVLALWLTRSSTRQRFGRRRWGIAVAAAVVLVLVAALGSGARQEVYSSSLPGQAELARRFGSQRLISAERAALVTALSEPFIEYHARLRGISPRFHAPDIQQYARVTDSGRLVFARSTCFPATLVEPAKASMARMDLLDALAGSGWLSTLTLLELYRSAANDAERGLALEEMTGGPASFFKGADMKEWVERELRSFLAASPSPAVRAKLEERIASLTPSSVTSASSPPSTCNPKSGKVSMIPGRSIGPVEVGMTRAEVKQLGAKIAPDPSGVHGDTVLWVDRCRVVFDQDRVGGVEVVLADLPAGLEIGGTTIPSSATSEDLARVLPNCGKAIPGKRERTIRCADGSTFVGIGEDGKVSLWVHRKDWVPGMGGQSCEGALGAKKASELVAECVRVSPATHPPCHASNPCALIRDEIKRGCKLLTEPAGRPTFCAAYDSK
jgi:hypothetical protein